MSCDIDVVLRRLVEGRIGAIDRIVDCSWQHGESQVHRLESVSGFYYLKQFAQARKFVQERGTYEQCAGAVPNMARCVMSIESPSKALLFSGLAGQLVESRSWTAAEEQNIFQHAGRWLRTMHDLSFADADAVPLSEALQRRAYASLQRAYESDLLEHDVVAWAESLMDSIVFPREMHRVPCHRDFTPRNWLWDADAEQLAVIDFEHSRADWWLLDCDRLAARYWLDKPQLAEVFFAAYGKRANDEEQRTADVLAVLTALSTIMWADEHNDRIFLEDGYRRLRYLRQYVH